MRWKHPEHGLVPPSEFIPIAERTGLLASIGPWMLKHGLRAGQDLGAAPATA